MSSALGAIPLRFEPDLRQPSDRARFVVRGGGYTIGLTATDVTLMRIQRRDNARQDADASGASSVDVSTIRMTLVGADSRAVASAQHELPGQVNHLTGNDPARWRTGIRAYGRVEFRDVYPGVTVVYYGNQRDLEYDFVVAAGADYRTIALAFEGSDGLTIDENGNLKVATAGRELIHRAPVVYQLVDGQRRTVEGRYTLQDRRTVGFHVGPHDRTIPLVIDPLLAYSTYLGGSGDDFARGVAVDDAGNTYVTGHTLSLDFPIGPLQSACNPLVGYSCEDIFVAKLDPQGSLVYSTHLGGTSGDIASAIAVDAAGSAYITGHTASADFPLQSPAHADFRGVFYDAFVTKLSPDGSVLQYSTYLGGSGNDAGNGIGVDADGRAYVAGSTDSGDFPTVVDAFQPLYGGAGDAFVTMLSPAGATLEYSTYLGGALTDSASGIAVDAPGRMYVVGETGSPNFPVRAALHLLRGWTDAFVTRLDLLGPTPVPYSTFLGGLSFDAATAVAVDAEGSAYVTGATFGADFPLEGATWRTPPGSGPLQPEFGGAVDAFVTKLALDGATPRLEYSTYLGGTEEDRGSGVAVDHLGRAHVTGFTFSPDFPRKDALHGYRGFSDAFVVKMSSDGSTTEYSTYLGGSGWEMGEGSIVRSGPAIARDKSPQPCVSPNCFADEEGVVLAGFTDSVDFPTNNPFQPGLVGNNDVFVVKLIPGGSPNSPPIADAGPDHFIAAGDGCVATVTTLWGTASTDPEGDSLTYTWTGPFPEGGGTIGGPHPTITLGLGEYVITLTVDDGRGGIDHDDVTVTVSDFDAPVFTNVPAPFTVEQTSPAGASVAVAMPAVADNCGPVELSSDAPAVFPPGTTLVTFTARDGAGNVAAASTSVTVVDTTPPVIETLSATPNVLSPPNHQLVRVRVSITTSDAADPAPTCAIASVSSNEPVQGSGDGDTAPDWVIIGAVTADLRAERAAKGTGRVYAVHVQCADAAGNRSLKPVTVTVPR